MSSSESVDPEEIRQLRENLISLTAQLDETNRAWQQYQQTQLNNFQTKLVDFLPIDENTSFDEIAQQIVDQITKEREDFSDSYQALERANNNLRSGNSIVILDCFTYLITFLSRIHQQFRISQTILYEYSE